MNNSSDLESAAALVYSLDSDGEYDDIFYDLLMEISDRDLQVPNLGEVRNQDGSVRKVKRADYSRGRKRIKTRNPWTDIYWLGLIGDPTTNDPNSRNGKEFRRMFRTPFPVFEDIVYKCRATGEPIFNYESKIICGEVTIPLELKILFVLRVLAGGLLIKDAAEMTNRFISNSEGTMFFKSFCKLFRQHFGPMFIKPLTGEALLCSLKEYAMLGLPGCVGSVDAVFVWWDCIPTLKQNLCKLII